MNLSIPSKCVAGSKELASLLACYEGVGGRTGRGQGQGLAPILITGGAGFIGVNLARHFLSQGQPVRILDNLSRRGVQKNLAELCMDYPDLLQIRIADIRDTEALRSSLLDARAIFHLAAQVAVTSSLTNPLEDFSVNAYGTINLLETLREAKIDIPLLFTSTNKVYGDLGHLELARSPEGYRPVEARLRSRGLDENCALDFYSPYGCSKGSADQYVLDYARTYRLHATVFRMSCIYGPYQYGSLDQGWVAHFVAEAMAGRTITIFGDGNQLRDLLFVDDLVRAMVLAIDNIEVTSGRAFNVGGGPSRALTLLKAISLIEEVLGVKIDVRFEEWRQGDQRYYVSDTALLEELCAWTPTVLPRQGIARLAEWLKSAKKVTQVNKRKSSSSLGVRGSRLVELNTEQARDQAVGWK
ncbi:MAG: NAD-dependent epimerase/dehydratase family protein [Bdellovibrionales bacterium]|nr:NAD-dependent epimerase/dehydratase family protein [Bdellovibrionales bacterium]